MVRRLTLCLQLVHAVVRCPLPSRDRKARGPGDRGEEGARKSIGTTLANRAILYTTPPTPRTHTL